MNVISRKTLKAFAVKHPDAEKPLDSWYKVAKKAKWQNLTAARVDYPHADAVGECTVFNIKGNDYRLIVKIKYERQTIYIRFVLTHAEYNKGGWKNDC
ncbi:MAG TPA: type II toxin-antitoxin system HigB family toxin [Blastocatellia bacterium]|nr:type II toxin-antitoxin system HigB family toxin [Blastocatellia bacterium]